MKDCNYCEDSFEDETSLLKHYKKQHQGELSRIDEKKVEDAGFSVGGANIGNYAKPALFALIIVAVLGVFAYVFFVPGTTNGGNGEIDAEQYPSSQIVHQHGQMTVVVDGQETDFSQPQYQVQDDSFHFESGNGERWHKHNAGVTLEYGLETLGFRNVTSDTFVYQGTRYSEATGDTIQYLVNGEEVDPQEYVFQEGDTVRVVVESGN